MDRIMITGASGFVAHHFIQYLFDKDPGTELMCVDIQEPNYDIDYYKSRLEIHFKIINLMDQGSLKEVFKAFRPLFVLHLASFSSVAYSWKHPNESFVNNTNIFLNLLDAVSTSNKECRILSVGSSEEYGNVTKEDIPIKERQRLQPISPYSVARVSQEMLSKLFSDSFGMDIIMTRSFNHIGPWQDKRFVVPSFVDRILDIERNGKKEGTIETGDITIIRDFVDVRDVVRAYYMLLEKGKNGEVFNVCSGRGVRLSDLIGIISNKIGVRVRTTTNPRFVRPNENLIVIGENYKIFDAVGWRPYYKLDETIKDLIADMKNRKV